MTEKNKLTPGEYVELVRGLKELGVARGEIEGLKFEFAAAMPEQRTQFLTPEEYEEAAQKLRKNLEKELYEAS